MKKILILLVLLLSFGATSQTVIPLVDFNRYFRSFQDGFFKQVTMQPVSNIKYGDNLAAYIDFRGNLVLYDGETARTVTNIETEFQVSDFLMAWESASTLNMWDNGVLQTLTYTAGQYKVKDSLIVFEDTRYNSVSVYYDGEVHELFTTTGDLEFPSFVGENIVAFKDNGDFYKVFWRGDIYDLDVWHDSYSFKGGTDMIAFNDPKNGSFAIFDNGTFVDVELFHMSTYDVGNKFVVYETQNSDLMLYKDEKTIKLSNFAASFYEVRDDVVLWEENGIMYAYQNGEKFEMARYIPEEYQLKNNVIAFRNFMGGVSAFIDGELHEITTQDESSFSIHGSSVMVELFNKSFIVFKDGRKFTL